MMFALGPLLHNTVANSVATGPNLGPEIVVNGDFSAGTGWNLPTNGVISGGQLVCTNASLFLWQSNAGIVAGHTYQYTYTISGLVSGSNVTAYLGSGETDGTTHSIIQGDGTFTENITPASSGELGLHFNACTCNIDNISVKEVL